MNLIAIDSTDDPERSETVVRRRTWTSEPTYPDEPVVEIWWNNNWVPTYFSDIREGDYYIVHSLRASLGPDQCFYAASDAKPRYNYRNELVGSIILRGSEIKRAPKTEKDITPTALPNEERTLLE